MGGNQSAPDANVDHLVWSSVSTRRTMREQHAAKSKKSPQLSTFHLITSFISLTNLPCIATHDLCMSAYGNSNRRAPPNRGVHRRFCRHSVKIALPKDVFQAKHPLPVLRPPWSRISVSVARLTRRQPLLKIPTRPPAGSLQWAQWSRKMFSPLHLAGTENFTAARLLCPSSKRHVGL